MFWKVSFRERDDIPEDIFKRTGFKEITEDNEYISRYDLTYLTPCFYQLRCKVSANNFFLFTFYNSCFTCCVFLSYKTGVGGKK